MYHAAVLRATRVRLCQVQEDVVQRRVAAARDLPKAFTVEMLPCPLFILTACLLYIMVYALLQVPGRVYSSQEPGSRQLFFVSYLEAYNKGKHNACN